MRSDIFAALAALAVSACGAFHFPASRAPGSIRNPLMTSLQAHDDGDGVALSRRAAASAAASLFVLGTCLPLPTDATATVGAATRGARVATWPGIEDLEPMYELKLSVDALAAGVKDQTKWPLIQKRLDRFFKGAILSEKNFYLGVAFQYGNDIKYDTGELPEYVRLDKEARFDAMEATMNNLEMLKKSLGGSDVEEVDDYARGAQASLGSWFALIPDADIKAVEQLFRDVKGADADRDGKLSDGELATLPENEREIWKRRVSKFG